MGYDILLLATARPSQSQ